jgi:hypothetical protein
MLLSRKERPKSLPVWAETLMPALKKDKRGVLLEKLLRHPWPDSSLLATLTEVVRFNRILLKSTVEQLPAILSKKDAPEAGLVFAKELFEPIHGTQGAEREFMTALLGRLGCGILMQERRSPQTDAVLRMIAQIVRQLRNLTKDESLQQRTWVLENLNAGNEPATGVAQVTISGARHLALAFDKAAQGFGARDILNVTARNLGLKPLGNKDEVTSYSPMQHEDTEGGMLPGETAVVTEPGWTLGADVVVRAKVKKGGSHV